MTKRVNVPLCMFSKVSIHTKEKYIYKELGGWVSGWERHNRLCTGQYKWLG